MLDGERTVCSASDTRERIWLGVLNGLVDEGPAGDARGAEDKCMSHSDEKVDARLATRKTDCNVGVVTICCDIFGGQ